MPLALGLPLLDLFTPRAIIFTIQDASGAPAATQAAMAPKEKLKDLGTFTDLLELVKRATSGERSPLTRPHHIRGHPPAPPGAHPAQRLSPTLLFRRRR